MTKSPLMHPHLPRLNDGRSVHRLASLAFVLAIAAVTPATVQAQSLTGARAPVPGAPSAVAAAPSQITARRMGYLGPGRVPNSVLILPPPPAHGSLAEAEDMRVFKATRALQGTSRWNLAAQDAVNYYSAFDCALGAPFSMMTAPKTIAMLQRVGADAGALTNLAKDHFERPRPLAGNDLPICTESQRASLLKSFSYPSGHSTYSWAMGLILAEIVPDRASDILARARAFGESRVVCGVHYVSDVEEGRVNGSILVAALHSDPQFLADLAAAKAELTGLRGGVQRTTDPEICHIALDAEIHTPWVNPQSDK